MSRKMLMGMTAHALTMGIVLSTGLVDAVTPGQQFFCAAMFYALAMFVSKDSL